MKKGDTYINKDLELVVIEETPPEGAYYVIVRFSRFNGHLQYFTISKLKNEFKLCAPETSTSTGT
jgi:hypothetical protein